MINSEESPERARLKLEKTLLFESVSSYFTRNIFTYIYNICIHKYWVYMKYRIPSNKQYIVNTLYYKHVMTTIIISNVALSKLVTGI